MSAVPRGPSPAPRLAELAQAVRTARLEMETARRGRQALGAEWAARHELRVALEAYVAELQHLHLPVPARVSTELRLIRNLGHRR